MDNEIDTKRRLPSEIFTDHFETIEKENWSGTVLEFFDLIYGDISVRPLAEPISRRIADSLAMDGMISAREPQRIGGGVFDQRRERLRVLYRDDFEIPKFLAEQFYGMPRELRAILDHFKTAGAGGENSQRALIIVGPTDSGKSDIAEAILWALKHYRNGVFFALKDSPSYEDPCRIIPPEVREKWKNECSFDITGRPYGTTAACGDTLKKKTEAAYGWPGANGHMRIHSGNRGDAIVVTRRYEEGVGIQTVGRGKNGGTDKDDIVNAILKCPDGVVHIVEMCNPARGDAAEFLYPLLTATKDRFIVRDGGVTSVGAAIIGTTTIDHFKRFMDSDEKSGWGVRFNVVMVRYALSYDDERDILKKIIQKSGYANYPRIRYARTVLSLFSVLSRLKKSNLCNSLEVKLYLYNGQTVERKSNATDPEELKKECGYTEGLDGLSPTMMVTLYERVAAKYGYVDAIYLMEEMRLFIKEKFGEAKENKEERDRYQYILGSIVRPIYNRWLMKDLLASFVIDMEETHREMYDRYNKELDFLQSGHMLIDPLNNAEQKPNDDYVKRVEKHAGCVSNDDHKAFRQRFGNFVLERMRKKERLHHRSFEELSDALDALILEEKKAEIQHLFTADTLDVSDSAKRDAMKKKLLEEMGYDRHPNALPHLLQYIKKKGGLFD
ncbi:hypothetical protein L0Y49_01890 [bacterium]|nr:hypothetical protein [bacterium]MCI0566289.1 hypothetical protein [bacterium]MCI0679917.1 hypothetical protein [bacterium]